jgi:hypothetical protein
MPLSEIARLRRQRQTMKRRIARYETSLVEYGKRLEAMETSLQALDPQLDLTPPVRNANPYFVRNELKRLAMDVLREADGPIGVSELVRLVLAAKGHAMPPRALRAFVRHRLTAVLSGLRKRGVVERTKGGWVGFL